MALRSNLTLQTDSAPRVAVITGGGSGIGLAAALEFARHGWRVGLIGRSQAALDDARRQVEDAGGLGAVAIADVTDEAALEHAATAIEAELGPMDVWVNNAAQSFYGKFTEVPPDAFRRVIDVNLMGTVHGTRLALKRMRPRNRGTIVQILSVLSYRGVPLQSAYSATKFGLRGFTEAVSGELLHERSAVHLTMVHPPAVNTPFYSHAGSVMDEAPRPPPPIYQPEIIGEAIYLAATSHRREWRVTGESIAYSLANKLAPAVFDYLSVGTIPLQKTRRKAVVERRDPTVWGPTSRLHGMHGPFDSESLSRSATWALTKAPAAVRFGLGMLALGMLGTAVARRR